MKRLVLSIVALTFSLIASVGADPPPSATDFLKQSMSRYQALKFFGAKCVWSEQFGNIPSRTGEPQATRTILYAAPNRFKIVSNGPGLVQTSVSDGVHLSEYTSAATLPAQTYPAPSSIATATTMQMQHPMFCGTLLYKFFGGPADLEQLAQTAKGAITYGPDVTVDGEPCKTVKFYGSGQYGHAQVAISTRDSLVRRIAYDSAPLIAKMRQIANGPDGKKLPIGSLPTSSVTTEAYSALAVDQEVASNAFDVTVPKGITVTDMSGSDSAPPVKIGEAAPDFTVTSLGGGRTARLSSLRGKVVLLDFWATWCPPCRRGLPETQKLAAQYDGKGLAVMAISDETAATISKFIHTNHYSFPAYRDTTGVANKAYKVSAIPTLAIIDGTGHLSAFFVGLQEPKTVLAALKKAGLATE